MGKSFILFSSNHKDTHFLNTSGLSDNKLLVSDKKWRTLRQVMDIASWPFCGCGYCVMLAVGQSVPEGDEVGSPTARTPEGCVAWGIRDPSLIPSLEEGQQHPSCESVTLLWIHASKCWPPSGPIRWMDVLKPHATHPFGVRAVRLTHFVPAGDVLAYGQQPSQRPLGTSWPTASNPMGLLFWGALYTGVPCFALHHLPKPLSVHLKM